MYVVTMTPDPHISAWLSGSLSLWLSGSLVSLALWPSGLSGSVALLLSGPLVSLAQLSGTVALCSFYPSGSSPLSTFRLVTLSHSCTAGEGSPLHPANQTGRSGPGAVRGQPRWGGGRQVKLPG